MHCILYLWFEPSKKKKINITKSFQIRLNLFKNIWYLQLATCNRNGRRENTENWSVRQRVDWLHENNRKIDWILFYPGYFITFESCRWSTQMQFHFSADWKHVQFLLFTQRYFTLYVMHRKRPRLRWFCWKLCLISLLDFAII